MAPRLLRGRVRHFDAASRRNRETTDHSGVRSVPHDQAGRIGRLGVDEKGQGKVESELAADDQTHDKCE